MSSSPGPASSGGGAAAAPRDAATVILLRPRPDGGYEVFLVKRAQQIAFMGGAHVFPGGRVDPKTDPNLEAAAVREVEEEAAVKLDVRSLRLFARWVTPDVEPKRFDARFFVAPVPAGQAAAADLSEVTEGGWWTPAAALAAADRGEIALPPPTLWNLLDLAALPAIDAVLAEAARRVAAGIEPTGPRVRSTPEGRIALVLPGDPQYESAGAPAPPDDRKRRFEIEDGRWRAFRGSGVV